MNKSYAPCVLAAVFAATTGYVQAQNISQNQSGSSNSQSMSIGNTGDKPVKKAKGKKEKISSTQNDSTTGNKQSADVSGGGSGNISQNQSGTRNNQSLSVGGNTGGKLPTVTQSQTGADKKQSMVVDGKKVDAKSN